MPNLKFAEGRNWPERMPHVSTKEHCRILWLILIETESGGMPCPAPGIIREELEKLLDVNWRGICQREWGT